MKTKFGMVALLALGALTAGAAEWTVSDVRARQRRPWDGTVDIDFHARGAGCCTFGLVVSNGNEAVSVSAASLVGGEAVALGEGYVRLTWDPTVDHPGEAFPKARYYPVAKPCDAPPYLVVDLETGAKTFRGLDFANEVNADAYKLHKLALRYVPATTSDTWKAMSGGDDFFYMGLEDGFTSTDNSTGVEAPSRSKPRHPVRLTRGYYLGVFEVTQQQWRDLWGSWKGWYTQPDDRPTRPIESVGMTEVRGSNGAGFNWPDDGHAVHGNTFLGCLRYRTGLAFDLPTEAQWEFACRAGTTGIRYASDAKAIGRYWNNWSNMGYTTEQLTNEAYRAEIRAAGGATAKVGSYAPNAWGFYDMLGNVQEFCLDASMVSDASVKYASGLQTDPTGPSYSDPWRIVRGGCWWEYAKRSTAVYRELDGWKARVTTGLRVCLDAGEVVK